MEYKRLELYVGWTCNQKCTYCREYEHMEKHWNTKVSKYDILKNLIKYKKLGYNHVTFLGGEPFIQAVFCDSLKIRKKLGYNILVATNCTTLHIDSQARKFLPYIDELIISFEAIDKELQQKISRTNVFVDWEKVFENINKYWSGHMLKANIVVTQDNKNKLFEFVTFLFNKGIKNISITYPDLGYGYYSIEHILNNITPTYSEVYNTFKNIYDYYGEYIILKLVDVPFCIFSHEHRKNGLLTDDFDYSPRLTVEAEGDYEIKNNINLPRERIYIDKCYKCKYFNVCWGISNRYEEIYGLDEINPII